MSNRACWDTHGLTASSNFVFLLKNDLYQYLVICANLNRPDCVSASRLIMVVTVTDGLHPAATQHMAWFISGPHDGDPLYVITAVLVIASIVGLGILFFTLHSLPERLGHKKLQFEVVAVLGLLSLFTHQHAFWVAGLLLALIDLPDFATPLKRMARALENLSGTQPLPEEFALTSQSRGDARSARGHDATSDPAPQPVSSGVAGTKAAAEPEGT